MIPEPGDAARAVPVPKTFHEQTDGELTKAKIKQMEADDQAIQTILLGLPEDIYAAVDNQPLPSTYIQQPQPNNNYNPQPPFNQNYMQQPLPNPKDITDPTTTINMNPSVQNVRNQKGLIVVPGIANLNPNGNGNVVAAQAKGNAIGHNGNQIKQASTSGTQTDKAPIYDSDGSAEIRAQLFDKVSEQKGTTKGTRMNTMFTKQSILGKPPSSSYKPKLYSVTPLPKSKVPPTVGELNVLSKPVTSNSAPFIRELKVVQTVNVITPRIFRTNPSKTSRIDKDTKVGGPSSASSLPLHLLGRKVKRLREDTEIFFSDVRCLDWCTRTRQSEDSTTHTKVDRLNMRTDAYDIDMGFIERDDTRTIDHVLALEDDNCRLRRRVDSLEMTEMLGWGAVEARPSESIDVLAVYGESRPLGRLKRRAVKRLVKNQVAEAIAKYERNITNPKNAGGSGPANAGGVNAPEMESVFEISKFAEEDKELWTLPLKGDDIEGYNNPFHELALMCPDLVTSERKKIKGYVRGLPERVKANVISSKPVSLHEAINMAHVLVQQAIQAKTTRIRESNKRKWEDHQRNNNNHINNTHHQHQTKRQEAAKSYVAPPAKDCRARAPGRDGNSLQNVTCYGCREKGHYKDKCPNRRDQPNEGARGRAYVIRTEEPQKNLNVVAGTFLLNDHYASILFDLGAEKSFVSITFTPFIDISPTTLDTSYEVELANRK
nr:hypothetical protein [Tanacetum cinerariifolium]